MAKTINKQNILRYNRQIVLPSVDIDGQEKLLNATVLIIGLGGLGCACAQFLVASGVGKLILVDDDSVELSNLQRQILHSENDIGKLKVESAFESLKAMNSEVSFDVIDQRLDDEAMRNLTLSADLVVDCSDNLATRNQVNKTCWDANTPLVSGAAIRMEGQLFAVQPSKKSACYGCVSQLFGERNLSCVESGILSPVVGVIGSSQALMAIRLLTDNKANLVGKLHIYDAATLTWQKLRVPKNPNCSVCQSPSRQ